MLDPDHNEKNFGFSDQLPHSFKNISFFGFRSSPFHLRLRYRKALAVPVVLQYLSFDLLQALLNCQFCKSTTCFEGRNAGPLPQISATDLIVRPRGLRQGRCNSTPACRHKKAQSLTGLAVFKSGEGEIRTHGGLAPTLVFKTRAINHSTTSPRGSDNSLCCLTIVFGDAYRSSSVSLGEADICLSHIRLVQLR